MRTEAIERMLCKAFCGGFSVEALPIGYAVATPFDDGMGDPLTFYVRETEDGSILEDDGDFISSAIAAGVDLDTGSRSELLDDVLRPAGARWDRDTFQIVTDPLPDVRLGRAMVEFVSALLRSREVARLSPQVVRNTFVEDALSMLEEALGDGFFLMSPEEGDDNAPDMIVRPKSGDGPPGVIFLAATTAKLLSALVRHLDSISGHGHRERVVAIVESLSSPALSRSKFEMSQNRGLPMPIWRGHENAAILRTKAIISQPEGQMLVQ